MNDKHISSNHSHSGGHAPHGHAAPPAQPAAQPAPAPLSSPTGAFALLIQPLQRAVAEEGYTTPTPIQERSIQHLLDGRDLLGCAQTGTGKTAAFVLPILQYLANHPKQRVRGQPRTLILAPTRELAAQIGDSIRAYGRHVKMASTVIFGGVGQHPQVVALNHGVDILVATPGRLLDLMEQRHVRLDGVEVFVLDEADRMLDMGFIHDVKRVIKMLPSKRQSLFFSATLAPEVVKLANTMVQNPVHITVTPEQPTVEKIDQRLIFVDQKAKTDLLIKLLRESDLSRVIVFTRMKHMANKVSAKLMAAGIGAAPIHGNKSQSARTQAMAGFRSGKVRVLVATDIAARGIDVDDITHVINYDLPMEPETYVHRIGRTARAGAEGDAISFCSPQERDNLRDIERLIRKSIPVDTRHGPATLGQVRSIAPPAMVPDMNTGEAQPARPRGHRPGGFHHGGGQRRSGGGGGYRGPRSGSWGGRK